MDIEESTSVETTTSLENEPIIAYQATFIVPWPDHKCPRVDIHTELFLTEADAWNWLAPKVAVLWNDIFKDETKKRPRTLKNKVKYMKSTWGKIMYKTSSMMNDLEIDVYKITIE